MNKNTENEYFTVCCSSTVAHRASWDEQSEATEQPPHTPPNAGIGATRTLIGTGLWKPLGENRSRVTITRAVSYFLPPTRQQLEGSVTWRDSKTLVCEQSLATLLQSEAAGLHAQARHKGSRAGAGSPVHTKETGRRRPYPFILRRNPFL